MTPSALLAGAAERNAALALCALLLLKEYLVRGYSLLPDRMRGFACATAEKRKLVRHRAQGLVALDMSPEAERKLSSLHLTISYYFVENMLLLPAALWLD